MRNLALLLVLAVALFPASAFASCPDQTGPYYVWYGSYYVFTFDPSCASTSGSTWTTTFSTCSVATDGYQFGSGTVDYSMTVPTGMGGNHWQVELVADMNDPSSYSLDGMSATVIVWHNGSPTVNTIFIHNGNQGSLSCQFESYYYFSAADGDTIEVSESTVNYTSATMKMSPPTIFSN
jgi:hypothetical protein